MNVARLAKEGCADAIREAVGPADTHYLAWLESEAIHILREVAGQCRNCALLFAGGQGVARAAAPRREGVPAGTRDLAMNDTVAAEMVA